ncbi:MULTISPECIES: 1-acyl-sn-glycerol-3-phosphate acyltransferase [Arenibacter]|uniref:1-acyl-sn-glycerol-3-phosphate acyltransferase n=1 Tax=Arenibacter TaxID=178469 RepID=UPI0004DEF514|nr:MULTISPECIES: 1-acyl-sn-glycerol-3-phosphate acyltransferase [Arenibacter]GBF19571.1 2-acyl-glycerophospho-ethanolamine acyltransferase [Arenibacter sp. NBRC 103722]
MGSFLYRIYQYVAKKRLLSGIGLLALFAILLYFAFKIEFEEDITKLIPSNSKTEEVQKVLKSVNFSDKIIVNIVRESEAPIEELTSYATDFLDSISKKSASHIKKIQGKIDDGDLGNTLGFVYENAPLLLDKEDYITILKKLDKDSIAKLTQKNYRTLISPSGIVAKEMILKDPLGISFIALKKLRGLGIGDQFTIKDGFLLSKDLQNILLFITPAHPSSETVENTKFVAELYETQNQLGQLYKDKVKSEYYGATLIAVANAQQIKNDIRLTVTIALSILMGILILFYRKLTIPIILFAPTLFGATLSVALLYLTRGKISAISLGIGSVLLGVTLDYSLHILTQIRNNPSVKTLYSDVAQPVIMSSITTALAFLCLLFLDSQALQDLGIFAAVSVIGSCIFALLFIPHVYRNTDNLKVKYTLLDRIASYNLHKNKWSIAILAGLLIASIFFHDKVIFNKDIAKLNFEPTALVQARERLDALTNLSSKSIYLAVYGKDGEKVLQTNNTLSQELDSLKNNGEILSFSSIGNLVLSQEKQQEKIDLWKEFWNEEVIKNTKENLVESGTELGFKPNSFDKFYSFLNKDFRLLNIGDYSSASALPIDDHIVTDNDFTTVTSLIKLKEGHEEKVKDIFRAYPQTLVIDRQEMNEMFLGNLKNDFNKLIGYSLGIVVLILFFFFRSFSLVLVTSIPILLTWWLTIGIMGMFHIEFNIFNIIISTFIFGLGIDYSIFITTGLLKEYGKGEEVLRTHRTSILLSAITTVLGIGVLIFAKHPALHSISLVSLIGILSAVFVAFTIQPLLFLLFIGSKEKRPISLRLLIHSVLSFGYYGSGGLLLSIWSVTVMKILPFSKKVKMKWFHKTISKFMKSVLYTNPFVSKKIINLSGEDFKKPAIIIANHTSFLDILAVGMLYPKIIYLVNDWVYKSPIFGKAVQLAGFYPVSEGIDNGLEHLRNKVAQGYSLMAFPEGTRSRTNKIRRFHKGAFYLAEKFNMDIVPVLIHGNSEVLPKGSFVIKDGSITVKILDRISTEDLGYGKNYRERNKGIAAYFRSEFQNLRNEVEGDTYFTRTILEDYRYKGDSVYRAVKKDLRNNSKIYTLISKRIETTDSIIHLSKEYGQLDFLLSLNAVDRKIFAFLADEEIRPIVKNSFITQQIAKLTLTASIEEALEQPADIMIIDLEIQDLDSLVPKIINNIRLVILVKDGVKLLEKIILSTGFKNVFEYDNLIILEKAKA